MVIWFSHSDANEEYPFEVVEEKEIEQAFYVCSAYCKRKYLKFCCEIVCLHVCEKGELMHGFEKEKWWIDRLFKFTCQQVR